VIDLSALTVTGTITLGTSLRPEAIALAAPGFLFITVPSAGPMGEVILLNTVTGTQTTVQANPDRSGGASDVVFFNGKLYFSNQTGGSVSALPFVIGTLGPITTVKVDLGVRALTVDAQDNLLVVSNEGSGTLVLVDLNTNAVVGRIKAVETSPSDTDDHSDHDRAANLPTVQSITPASSKAGTIITLMVTGANLGGAKGLVFDILRSNGDEGDGEDNNKVDDAFTVSNISVNSGGTQLTATVTIAAGAQTGQHVVRVTTANGESRGKVAMGNIFSVLP
jgi:hypothetical protein